MKQNKKEYNGDGNSFCAAPLGLGYCFEPLSPGLRSRRSLNPGLYSAALSGLAWARSQYSPTSSRGLVIRRNSPNGAAEYSQGIHPLVTGQKNHFSPNGETQKTD